MRHQPGRIAILAIAVLLAASCNSSPAAKASPGPSASVHSFAGGCAGTVFTDGVPPQWAQFGWTHATGAPWPVPWAMGSGRDALAYLFAVHLVAGGSPRSDGTNNKVLWVVQDAAVSHFLVDGHPLGKSEPSLEVAGGPSIVDPPSAGCWTFQLAWIAGGVTKHQSTINLDVLPKGSTPA